MYMILFVPYGPRRVALTLHAESPLSNKGMQRLPQMDLSHCELSLGKFCEEAKVRVLLSDVQSGISWYVNPAERSIKSSCEPSTLM